ncbi:hypothetical protein KY289_008421 [Solanum tuberosum]|nr:hypothetical protein KY289_008421 [Solanum tuberosum]
MNQLSAQLDSKPVERCANDDMKNSKAVLTRSGKIAGDDVKVTDEANTSIEEKDTIHVERSDQTPENNMPEEDG